MSILLPNGFDFISMKVVSYLLWNHLCMKRVSCGV